MDIKLLSNRQFIILRFKTNAKVTSLPTVFLPSVILVKSFIAPLVIWPLLCVNLTTFECLVHLAQLVAQNKYRTNRRTQYMLPLTELIEILPLPYKEFLRFEHMSISYFFSSLLVHLSSARLPLHQESYMKTFLFFLLNLWFLFPALIWVRQPHH